MDASILEKIHLAATKLLYPMDIEETCEIVAKEAAKLVKADYSTILLSQDKQLKRIYASDPLLFDSKLRPKGNTYTVFKTRQPKITPTSDLKGAPVHSVITKLDIKASMSVPLSYRNKSWGVLTVFSKKEGSFTPYELSILQLFGSLAALSIRKTQLYNETRVALESRDLFISMAAHELRTPITTISGYTQLLHSKLSGANTPESRWVDELSWETLRLTQLVNELLEVERIKAGQLRYVWKECRLRSIIQRALNDFRFTHPNHRVTLIDQIKNGDDKIVGDFDKLLQAIINLLDNAAKYSPPGTEIIVTTKARIPYMVLSIKDHGHGISKKDLPEVWEKFYRADTSSKEGMGLGLYLVKNIIKQHKGNIDIHSKEGRGTRVEIKLPQTKHG